MKDYQKECPLCGHIMELEPNLCHGYICINCHTVFQEQEFNYIEPIKLDPYEELRRAFIKFKTELAEEFRFDKLIEWLEKILEGDK